MSTHANFYVGTGANAEWIGSLHRDGYPSGVPTTIMRASHETEYRRLVNEFLTHPKQKNEGAYTTGGPNRVAYDYCFAPAPGSKLQGPHVWWPESDKTVTDTKTGINYFFSRWVNCAGDRRQDQAPFPNPRYLHHRSVDGATLFAVAIHDRCVLSFSPMYPEETYPEFTTNPNVELRGDALYIDGILSEFMSRVHAVYPDFNPIMATWAVV